MNPKRILQRSYRRQYRRRSKLGQGITEYTSVIAFVALLVSLVFSITRGTLYPAISGAYQAAATNINNLAAAPSNVL